MPLIEGTQHLRLGQHACNCHPMSTLSKALHLNILFVHECHKDGDLHFSHRENHLLSTCTVKSTPCHGYTLHSSYFWHHKTVLFAPSHCATTETTTRGRTFIVSLQVYQDALSRLSPASGYDEINQDDHTILIILNPSRSRSYVVSKRVIACTCTITPGGTSHLNMVQYTCIIYGVFCG